MPAVLRLPTFMRAMARLALLAALLMAIVPTAGRMLAAERASGTQGWGLLCTAEGMRWVNLLGASPPGEPSPEPGTPANPDCAECIFCTLALALPVLLGLALLFKQPRPVFSPPAASPPRCRPVRLCGLGAQGPPLSL
jgi:hypothetical protein